MWAEYVVTRAQFCMSLRKNVELEQGAALLVNPITAWALMDGARRGAHRAVVQTAAASALGRVIVWEKGFPFRSFVADDQFGTSAVR
jgi:NADPH:quinone reductase